MVFGAVALLAMPPVTIILASASVREYTYKELSYRLVTDRVISDHRDPEEIAVRLNQFVDDSTYPGGGSPLDTHAWNDLLRGIGWCDQDTWMLGTLLATREIPGRMVFLNSDDDKVAHTMAEVYLDGEWRLFDPLYGLVFRAVDGRLASLPEVSANLDLVRANPRVRALPADARRKLEEFYEALLVSESARNPGRWAPLTDAKRASRARAAVQSVLDAMWAIVGTWGAHRFQDLYLELLPEPMAALDTSLPGYGNRPVMRTEQEDPALFLYYRARNYHLYNRVERAEALYREIVVTYPTSTYAEKGAYFLGDLDVDRNPGAAVIQLEQFLKTYPASAWRPLAHTALGHAHERLGNAAEARVHYAEASIDPFVDAASRLTVVGSTE
jgi:hypothetical protein